MDVQIPIRRFKEVAEEYGMTTVYVGEAYSSTTCPVHRDGKCAKRIKRGLLKCTLLNKVFNTDLAGAYNILATPITPSPEKGRGNRAGDRPGATGKVAPNLPALTVGTLAP
jgi:putative transposase